MIVVAVVFFLASFPEVVGPPLLVVLPVALLLNYLPGRGVRKKVEEKGRNLRELPYDVLQEMEGEEQEYTTVAYRQANLAVIVEQESPETLRVVVRGVVLSGFLLVQHTRFDGFYRSRDGTLRPMPSIEFDNYEVILG